MIFTKPHLRYRDGQWTFDATNVIATGLWGQLYRLRILAAMAFCEEKAHKRSF